MAKLKEAEMKHVAPAHSNLLIELHGLKLRVDGVLSPQMLQRLHNQISQHVSLRRASALQQGEALSARCRSPIRASQGTA